MAKDVRVLEIFFSDASATFSAGSEVSGGVVIVTNADIKAKGKFSIQFLLLEDLYLFSHHINTIFFAKHKNKNLFYEVLLKCYHTICFLLKLFEKKLFAKLLVKR